MSVSIFQEIKLTFVNSLLRWRKQVASGLIVLAILLLLTVLNKLSPNNSAWLQGSWTNQSAAYSFKAQNESLTCWTIKYKGALALKRVRVTVDSNKKRLIMTDDGNNIEYHMTRTGRKQIKLEIVRNGKSENPLKLKKQ